MVITAMENEEYWWRSVESMAIETGLSEGRIRAIIVDLTVKNKIVTAPRRDKFGRVLFTTRDHYRKTRPFFVKLMTALTNQIQ